MWFKYVCACMPIYLCELQVKVKDAMVWLALQEKKLLKLQKDSASETYFNKYHVSKTLSTSSYCFGERVVSICLEKYTLENSKRVVVFSLKQPQASELKFRTMLLKPLWMFLSNTGSESGVLARA